MAQLDLAEGSELIYSLLRAFGLPKAGLARLRSGSHNRSTTPGETLWKGRVFDRYEAGGADLHAAIDDAAADERIQRERPRFVIVRNAARLLALDTLTRDTLDISLAELHGNVAFFLPWAGIEKQQLESLHYADVKAAQRMALLYAEIVKANAIETEQDAHRLNVFFARLLFCFFAEDTGVFPKGAFTGAIASLTNPSGEDAASFLNALFKVLDTPEARRRDVPAHLRAFGYVNGKLFSDSAPAPHFTAKARAIVIESGTLNWSEINPDIFGSMMQAVVQPRERQAFGMHYTSVENILKVIRPLFLDSLDTELAAADSVPRLRRFIKRLANIRVFDPACGSGNFLIIAYKELRRREHRALQRIAELDRRSAKLFTFSEIQLESFYGIEVDDFAHEVAMLSLWLAKHQMNVAFRELFGAEIPLIPLRDAGNMVCGNATKLDWQEVCPKDVTREIYVIGNPPYVGSSMQNAEQKREFVEYFETTRYPKNLDYIALWFLNGARYIADGQAQLAFVTTNSVSQGDHVGLMWPLIYAEGVEVAFAYQSFPWTNRARGNAGVTCAIVGLSAKPPDERVLFIEERAQRVANIGPYLLATPHNAIIVQRRSTLADLPPMVRGSQPTDGGHLNFSATEREEILSEDRRAEAFMRRYAGAKELLGGGVRYCFWITDADAERALTIGPIARRAEQVRAMRMRGSTVAQAMADRPYRFLQRPHKDGQSILVPLHSSERRKIIPMGFLDSRTVISNAAGAVYDAEPWLFALLQSRMHTAWVGTVGGRIKTDYRYSAVLCYNTFPVPPLSSQDKARLAEHALAILEARERHSDCTLGDLYIPDKMPLDLQRVHEALDETIDALYGLTAPSDTERLGTLFTLYERMTAAETVAA
ncbi:MAG: class I SAM-dependent DNA methyltransferase [Solirubrobacteraceae bacterium]